MDSQEFDVNVLRQQLRNFRFERDAATLPRLFDDCPRVQAHISADKFPSALKLGLYIPFIFWDICLSALCGLAAVAVGGAANKSPYARDALGAAALAGVVRAVVLNIPVVFALLFGRAFLQVFWYIVAGFGATLSATAVACSLCLGQVPKELLAAAAVATIPLCLSNILRRATTFTNKSGPLSPIFAIAAGLIFAAMAKRQGFYVCSLGAAAAAAVVYDVIYAVGRLPCDCLLAFTAAWNHIFKDLVDNMETSTSPRESGQEPVLRWENTSGSFKHDIEEQGQSNPPNRTPNESDPLLSDRQPTGYSDLQNHRTDLGDP